MADRLNSPHPTEQSGDSGSVRSTPEVAKKNGQPVKKRSVGAAVVEQPMFEDSRLPEGWTRSLIQRQGGATAGKYDVYIMSPQQKKFRSRNELRAYFERTSSPLEAENFDFSVCGKELKTPSGSLNDVQVVPGVMTIDEPKVKVRRVTLGQIRRIKAIKMKRGRYFIPKNPPSESQRMIEILRQGPANNPELEYPGFNASPYFHWSEIKKLKQKAKANVMAKKWTPPRSPLNLLQESVYHDPWQLLVATILLNRSSAGSDPHAGKKVAPVFFEFLGRFPRPETVTSVNIPEIAALIRPLGLHEKRAHIIVRFTYEYLHEDWTYPNELFGIGKYGNDSYRIFCINEWRKVSPCDALLIAYRNWLINNWRDFCEDPSLATDVGLREGVSPCMWG